METKLDELIAVLNRIAQSLDSLTDEVGILHEHAEITAKAVESIDKRGITTYEG